MQEKILANAWHNILAIFIFTNLQVIQKKGQEAKLGNSGTAWPCTVWLEEVVIISLQIPRSILPATIGEDDEHEGLHQTF